MLRGFLQESGGFLQNPEDSFGRPEDVCRTSSSGGCPEDVQRMSRGCPKDVQRMSSGRLQDIQARGFQRMSYRHPLDVRRNPPDSCRNPLIGFQRMSRGCPEDVQWTSFGLLWMWMSCRHPTDVHWTSYRHPLDILQTSSGRLQESCRSL